MKHKSIKGYRSTRETSYLSLYASYTSANHHHHHGQPELSTAGQLRLNMMKMMMISRSVTGIQ